MKSVNEKHVKTLHQQINDITAAKENAVQILRQQLTEIAVKKNCIEQEWNKSEQCNIKLKEQLTNTQSAIFIAVAIAVVVVGMFVMIVKVQWDKGIERDKLLEKAEDVGLTLRSQLYGASQNVKNGNFI